jgi:predicted nucleotide-binding protein (sugar kinase/HSP70/actin superfamily)
MRLGIPRALLFHKYAYFWQHLFLGLGWEVVLSPPTNREILTRGAKLAVDESCLSVKIFLGHVAFLQKHVDYVLVPRLASLHRRELLCVKFWALPDIVRNTFPRLRVLSYAVDVKNWRPEILALAQMFREVGIAARQWFPAWIRARRRSQRQHRREWQEEQRKVETRTNQPRILLVSHPYTSYDAFLGSPILRFLRMEKITVFFADRLPSRLARRLAKYLSPELYWTFSREQLGAIYYYRRLVDGIIFLMTFPCGPDALVVHLAQQKLSRIPFCVLTLDELQTQTGLQTRLESFVDIIRARHGEK